MMARACRISGWLVVAGCVAGCGAPSGPPRGAPASAAPAPAPAAPQDPPPSATPAPAAPRGEPPEDPSIADAWRWIAAGGRLAELAGPGPVISRLDHDLAASAACVEGSLTAVPSSEDVPLFAFVHAHGRVGARAATLVFVAMTDSLGPGVPNAAFGAMLAGDGTVVVLGSDGQAASRVGPISCEEAGRMLAATADAGTFYFVAAGPHEKLRQVLDCVAHAPPEVRIAIAVVRPESEPPCLEPRGPADTASPPG